MTNAVLQVKDLCKSFGGIRAIQGLSFEVGSGEILGLIGPNGSGKSTTVNTLAGVFPATSGTITLSGARIEKLPEYLRVVCGLARTFQTASVFPDFTVRQQIMLGGEATLNSHPLSSAFGLGRSRSEKDLLSRKVQEILEITDLLDVADKPVGTISSAQQRFLMIATTLATGAKVVLLDEPAAGMVSHERKTLSDLICRIRDRGISVLVIEHHMALIMEVCDRIVVLNFGSKIAEGTPQEIRDNRAVIDAYLGEAA